MTGLVCIVASLNAAVQDAMEQAILRGIINFKSKFPHWYSGSLRYCNGFAQSVSRQQLGKHFPTCNNGRCVSVAECYSSLLGNSQCTNELAG
jgi:hypothetical protein